MSKWIVDIHGEIEGDYEIIKKYEEPKTDVLDKIRAEIRKKMAFNSFNEGYVLYDDITEVLDKYKTESEVSDADSN